MPVMELTALAPSPIPLIRSAATTNPSGLVSAHRRGELTRVIPGVYVGTAAWRTLAPGKRYLAKVHAVAARHPELILCGPSAAALLGVVLARTADPIHVLDARGTSRLSGAVRTFVSRDEREIESQDGILFTSRATRSSTSPGQARRASDSPTPMRSGERHRTSRSNSSRR
ncbi:hypothetical protein [Microbacterium panaciterrae]|uniref:AbiEi antitoxin C-terminal domain-containing protein n=1 Tax=Microbacterium panaciterrae TaxID=985759 RepID=A0ABP8PR33_9MICO